MKNEIETKSTEPCQLLDGTFIAGIVANADIAVAADAVHTAAVDAVEDTLARGVVADTVADVRETGFGAQNHQTPAVDAADTVAVAGTAAAAGPDQKVTIPTARANRTMASESRNWSARARV